ncbi:F0F1 ATP synthase subunit epsilon [Futiania mangrovi]|uniref:ATP synthase epsilon chain n=1 Tax=Futiania mangrovi TaxID=2959716 RepID=A0A9J6P9S2_9PROT|nr:F0F1 ATP synthase subunit epsilon [Futiania mangrovii]MCP1335073.1 F0F1 ATP synthase subunit epsilon [Futiania mangrovii]
MRTPMELTVTTPLAIVLRDADVTSVRAEDASGGFGIWPGHRDFLTVLGASVLRWKRAGEDRWRYCALHGGVMRVTGGARLEVACREAVPGDDLAALETDVRARFEAADDAARRARGEQMRLHAVAIRRLMQRLGRPDDETVDALAEAFR